MNRALLQRKIVGRFLILRQLHSRTRIGKKTYGSDLQAIFAGGLVLNPIVPLTIGKHNRRDPGLNVLCFDKCTLERATVDTVYGSSNRRSTTHGTEEQQQAPQREEPRLRSHGISFLPFL
jgi:hypothetical protein